MKRISILLMLFLTLFTTIVNAEVAEQNNSQNTDLKILRLNYEGMIPAFSKEIKEYYFVTERDIESLEITVVPENENATVTIEGNENLRMGKNTIVIKVVSEDKNYQSQYYIYVTKTDNIELANTNLENLAIRQGTLEPEFDNQITQYKVEVANDIETIDLLAIPQSMNASLQITGNEELKIGDNEIVIKVLAEDGVTEKVYRLTVHRRSTEEQSLAEENQKIQAERVAAIIEQKADEKIVMADNEQAMVNIIKIIAIVAIIAVVVAVVSFNPYI